MARAAFGACRMGTFFVAPKNPIRHPRIKSGGATFPMLRMEKDRVALPRRKQSDRFVAFEQVQQHAERLAAR